MSVFRVLTVVALVALVSGLHAMTVEIPSAGRTLIEVGEDWRFFRGKTPPSDPPDAWKELDFTDSGWELGPSGFGYGDGDDATELEDMEGNYVSVYIRKEFIISPPVPEGTLQLIIDYDDGFVAYLNGDLMDSRHMPPGTPDFQTDASSHEAGSPETIPLGKSSDLLREGKNVLAIEGHNTGAGSTDFSLIPSLRIASDIVKDGAAWVVTTETIMVSGTAPIPDTVSVKVNGSDADFNPADGAWQAEIALSPGHNLIEARALDAEMAVDDTGAVEIVYIPASRRVGGEIVEETVWSADPSPYIVEETVVVEVGAVLRVEAGTKLFLKDTASLVVFGQLLADGTEESPITFTHYGDGTTWGSIVLDSAADSRLAHSVIEYSSSATSYAGEDYVAAVAVVGTHLDVDGCTLQKLPEESPTAEGDGIDLSAGATARISNSQFLSIGEGVHTFGCYVLVENCLFTDMRGDNDGVDMDEESDPVPVIRNNLFIGSRDDALHPDRTSAIITGNVVTGCGDHGIVLRNKCTPYLANNIIYDCGSGGLAIENQCDALLVNNTIYDCGRGLRLFHLEREGADPGGGFATVRNCIIWNCPQTITLADDSEVTVTYSDVNGTSVWEGEGNINADPLFVDAANADFHLTKLSPCIDSGTSLDAPPGDFDGYARWRGGGYDVGAYESPYWPFVDTDGNGLVDGWEMHYFGALGNVAGDDSDGDGLANATEYDLGTDPVVRDTDDDGLHDAWELAYGFNPLIAIGKDGPLADPDKDGSDNLAEHTAGTDPTDPASKFEIAEVIAAADTAALKWQAKADREYHVLASTDQQNWTEEAIIPPGAERLAEWLDETSNEYPRRFYRLSVTFPSPPPP